MTVQMDGSSSTIRILPLVSNGPLWKATGKILETGESICQHQIGTIKINWKRESDLKPPGTLTEAG